MGTTERINYFGGFEDKPAHYEDNLTRAFLVLLRLVPAVQAVFIDSLREVQIERGDRDTVPARTEPGATVRGVWTQTTRLHTDEGRVLSILLTSDEWHAEASVQASDRSAVYDGVLHYGERWVLVVENKPYGNVWEGQLNPNLQGASGLEVDPRAVVVVWEDIIARLHGLLEGEWLGVTQSLLVYDFLRYVQSEFKWLNPYPTLASCGDDPALLNHRCAAIMKELAPGRLEYHQGGGHYIDAAELRAVRRVLLSVEEAASGWDLLLRIYPGDTVAQARTLYTRVDTAALARLLERWEVHANLHFSHISKHLHWCRPRPSVEGYVNFWREHPEWIRNVREDDFSTLCSTLTEGGMMDDHDRAEFDRLFVRTNRSSANVCPGLRLRYRWPAAEAVRLEGEGRLNAEIEERVREAIGTWGAEAAWQEVAGRE